MNRLETKRAGKYHPLVVDILIWVSFSKWQLCYYYGHTGVALGELSSQRPSFKVADCLGAQLGLSMAGHVLICWRLEKKHIPPPQSCEEGKKGCVCVREEMGSLGTRQGQTLEAVRPELGKQGPRASKLEDAV